MKRGEIFNQAKRIVIKVGTNVLTKKNNALNLKRVENMVKDIALLRKKGKEVFLVSSGAIGAGMGRLHLKRRPQIIPLQQAAAAVGQSQLMFVYDKLFRRYRQVVGQVLLTQEALTDRKRYLNARNTLMTLISLNVLPVINENDTVAVDEIKVGDNDILSALVANLVEADLLIILSDIDGFYTGDPKKDKKARLILEVEKITAQVESMASGTTTETAAGGMQTKIQAAKMVTRAGEAMIIANGTKHNILSKLFAGEKTGTLFLTEMQDKMASRKRWIAFRLSVKGVILLDKGAREALVSRGKSLLPSGIFGCKGKFQPGDVVSIQDDKGREIARGMINYSHDELEKIKGKKTQEIEKILGYKYYDEIVHRNNMVIL
ncbi:MAG: glutamate 5-kinase [Candidatus Ratteibacteria bacterium]|nr:glutamate 5-kinase [Candidatus Ratteibacteria bacterium]